jgi:hypothetical protein
MDTVSTTDIMKGREGRKAGEEKGERNGTT